MKLIKRIGWVLLILLLVAQAFRPAKNDSKDKTKDISNRYAVPDSVKAILSKACDDCHSNETQYPWYANIQPVAWWLNDHIKDGKRHLNFNEFDGYRIARQYKKLEECIEQVKEGEMPLSSYTLIHKEAVLSDAEKQTLFNWCENVRDSIKAHYPADSLVIKRKK
jgi:hypothetical protein